MITSHFPNVSYMFPIFFLYFSCVRYLHDLIFHHASPDLGVWVPRLEARHGEVAGDDQGVLAGGQPLGMEEPRRGGEKTWSYRGLILG